MAENSNIEWTDHTFNPWIGCTKVSPGCAHCYAETLNRQRQWTEWGPGKPRKPTAASTWKQPMKWDRKAATEQTRRKVFCASLADWLDPDVPKAWRNQLMHTISMTPNLDWLLLTKRIELFVNTGITLPPNVWLGTSAENQEYWDKRVPVLLQIPATKHFVSAEPLLGPIDMGRHRPDWLIVGGESGPNARPMDARWVRHLRDQCADRNGYQHKRTAFFFKQWGGVNKKAAGHVLDGKVHHEFPNHK